jgi:DNA-binding Lrp family transcriptional regulator
MRERIKLDALDRKIIDELQRDGALSHPDLAERVGSTPPSCWRRVRQLEESGVFRGTVRLVDQEVLGQSVNVLCHVRMRNHTLDNIEVFEAFVRSEPRIMECFSMSGEWDYQLRVVAEDVADYEVFLMRTLLKHPSVAGAASHFALRMVKYQTAVPVPSDQ